MTTSNTKKINTKNNKKKTYVDNEIFNLNLKNSLKRVFHVQYEKGQCEGYVTSKITFYLIQIFIFKKQF